MQLIIAGSRGITDLVMVFEKLDAITATVTEEITVISGGARGVDRLGETWAISRGHSLRVMRAEWDRYGKSAGYRRNQQMAQEGTHLIAIWDGQSRGTRHMIDIAREHGLEVRIVRTDKESN